MEEPAGGRLGRADWNRPLDRRCTSLERYRHRDRRLVRPKLAGTASFGHPHDVKAIAQWTAPWASIISIHGFLRSKDLFPSALMRVTYSDERSGRLVSSTVVERMKSE